MKWLVLLLTFGCAQVTSLNLQKHEFGVLPTKIIWFQIAGLEEEQLGLLRFNLSGERKTAFEEHTCIGKSWGYSLYQLRETAEASFLSQITGRKNIKNNTTMINYITKHYSWKNICNSLLEYFFDI